MCDRTKCSARCKTRPWAKNNIQSMWKSGFDCHFLTSLKNRRESKQETQGWTWLPHISLFNYLIVKKCHFWTLQPSLMYEWNERALLYVTWNLLGVTVRDNDTGSCDIVKLWGKHKFWLTFLQRRIRTHRCRICRIWLFRWIFDFTTPKRKY